MTAYQNLVAKDTLSDVAKERIRLNLQQRLENGEKSPVFSPWIKRGLALALAVILICAVAIPTAIFGGDNYRVIPFDPENWVERGSGGGGGDPYNPAGISVRVTGGHKIYYEVGERFTLTCVVEIGQRDKKVKIFKEENGFHIHSVKKISTEDSKMYSIEKNGKRIPGKKTTYELVVDVVSDAEEISGALRFQYDDMEAAIPLGGYNVDGKVFFANSDSFGAFEAYLSYLLSQGFTQSQIRDLWDEYWRKHPSGSWEIIYG